MTAKKTPKPRLAPIPQPASKNRASARKPTAKRTPRKHPSPGKTAKLGQVGAGIPNEAPISLLAEPESSAGPDLDTTKLPMRQQVFIEEYMTDFVGTKAAIRAGYAPTDAASRASKLLDNPVIAAVVQARIDDKLEAIRMTRERVLDEYANIAEADGNELTEHRRVCCRHCHGAYDATTGARARQMTPYEYVRKKQAWDERRVELKLLKKRDPGEFKEEAGDWYNKRLPINDDCNECFGDGLGEVILKDTRNLSRRARAAYQGVREGKDGIEIKSVGRAEALGVLAKHHKIFDEAPQVNLTTVTSDALDEIYRKGVADSDAAKARILGRGDRVRAAAPKNG